MLRQSLQHIKEMWVQNEDYAWTTDQLKSVRQDLVVQHDRTLLALEVIVMMTNHIATFSLITDNDWIRGSDWWQLLDWCPPGCCVFKRLMCYTSARMLATSGVENIVPAGYIR